MAKVKKLRFFTKFQKQKASEIVVLAFRVKVLIL